MQGAASVDTMPSAASPKVSWGAGAVGHVQGVWVQLVIRLANGLGIYALK